MNNGVKLSPRHRESKEKPNPLKLQLKATDIAKYRIRSIDFRPAKFNNFSSTGEESSIVTSTGIFYLKKKLNNHLEDKDLIKNLSSCHVNHFVPRTERRVEYLGYSSLCWVRVFLQEEKPVQSDEIPSDFSHMDDQKGSFRPDKQPRVFCPSR